MNFLLVFLAVTSVAALTGKFLTISDLHPDEFYRVNSSILGSCHGGHRGHKHDQAGYWGTPVSDCDSPMQLIDATFHDLKSKWTNKLDFVIVMGDLARHDIDSNLPRTMDEIMKLNRNMSDRFQQVFPDIPIIPSIGNNDVFPHNIMTGGPSHILSRLYEVYNDYVPEEQYHTFARGGYFAVEVIPSKLAVVSLNTLYFFDSNKIVDGCPPTKKHRDADPGTEELDWLLAQLKIWRKRGMQVILSGHVPPGDYYEGCYSRFSEIVLAYQDTIVGSVFGHKNVDHFSLFSDDDHFNSARTPKAQALVDGLRLTYAAVPHKAHPKDYAFLHVAPSIIPTYLPAYRIWRYNTTDSRSESYSRSRDAPDSSDHTEGGYFSLLLQTTQNVLHRRDWYDILKKKKKKRKPKKTLRKHSSPHSPSRTNRFLSLLGYEQYFMDMKKANKHLGFGQHNLSLPQPYPEFELEYATYTRRHLAEQIAASATSNVSVEALEAMLKHDKPHLTPYEMPDLTIGRWLHLCRRLSDDQKMWKGFEERVFVSAEVS